MKVNKNMSDTMAKQSLFLKDKKRSNLKKRKLKIVARLEKELGVSRINHEPIESSYTSTKQNKTKNKTCRVSPMKK